MATSTPPTDPDSLAVLHALSRVELSPEDTYNALEGLRTMSGRAVTAAIEAHNAKIDSKLDAQGAKFDALESKLDTLRAMTAWGLAALGLLVAALRLFS
ncbi:MAG: hypothetical protein F4X77_09400 [Acidobacteriia bacterium]|nr:hypothetical protein [Terriglobia bacterium]MYC67536.1 hypothetical protein [Terriglobia bacterium]